MRRPRRSLQRCHLLAILGVHCFRLGAGRAEGLTADSAHPAVISP
jgi:hypothetical protein